MANGTGAASVLMRVVASSVCIADKAGKMIRQILKSGELGVVDKCVATSIDDHKEFDPQTEADRTAQRIIVGSLKQQYPGLTILGEEEGCEDIGDKSLLVLAEDKDVLKHECPQDYQNLQVNDLVVWVDPLDGTAEFMEGFLNHVTVLIGIAARGKAVAGVIHQPFYDIENKEDQPGRTIWGVVGLGTYGVNMEPRIPGRHIVTTTRSHGTGTVLEAVKAMEPDLIIRTGGAGFKVLQVIEGKADAYVYASPGTKKWDSCAPEAVLRAMGGDVTDMHGNWIQYYRDVEVKNWGGVLATMIDQHYYLSKVPQNVKDKLVLK